MSCKTILISNYKNTCYIRIVSHYFSNSIEEFLEKKWTLVLIMKSALGISLNLWILHMQKNKKLYLFFEKSLRINPRFRLKAEKGIWTLNLSLGKAILYQLSYFRSLCWRLTHFDLCMDPLWVFTSFISYGIYKWPIHNWRQ